MARPTPLPPTPPGENPGRPEPKNWTDVLFALVIVVCAVAFTFVALTATAAGTPPPTAPPTGTTLR